jgi:hypothetical protein
VSSLVKNIKTNAVLQVENDDWNTFRVAVNGRYFYGYKNGKTIVHTHADEMEAGESGISFKGNGTVKIRLIEFRNIE